MLTGSTVCIRATSSVWIFIGNDSLAAQVSLLFKISRLCAVLVISGDKSKLLHSNLDFQHLQYGNSCFTSPSSENKSGWSLHSELGLSPFFLCTAHTKEKRNFISSLPHFQPKLYFRTLIWTGEGICHYFECSEPYFYSSAVQMAASALIKHNQNILF